MVTRWGRFPVVLVNRLRQAIRHYLRFYGLEAIKRYFPKGGEKELENALQVFDESTLYRIAFTIGTGNDKYDEIIKHLEYGTAPHVITPRNAEALRFFPHLLRFYMGVHGVMPMAIRGDEVLVKRVDHPGTQAYRMYQQGLQDIRPELLNVIRVAIRESINEIARER